MYSEGMRHEQLYTNWMCRVLQATANITPYYIDLFKTACAVDAEIIKTVQIHE